MDRRPDDRALWNSVAVTLRNVVLPAVDDAFARAAVVQLVGLAAYAMQRGEDPAAARTAELMSVLDALADNEVVARHWPGVDGTDPFAAASAVLVDATGNDAMGNDAAGDAGNAARAALRPVLVRYLDEDLASTAVLGGPFRGRLPDA